MSILERAKSQLKTLAHNYRNARRMNRILRSAREGAPPAELFGAVSDDYWFWLLTEGCRKSRRLRDVLPGLPDEAMQAQFTGQTGDATLGEGFYIYTLFKRLAEQHAGGLAACGDVLEFGCGWGRVLRFFLKDVAPPRLWGIDCYPEALEFCQRSNRWCNFRLIDPMPPTALAADRFGLIYAFSVFSHLAEDAHARWLAEFHRLLRPGGLLIATTYGRRLFAHCAMLRSQKDLPPLWEAFTAFFPDTEQAQADFDSGKFCYSPLSRPWGPLDGSFFGAACIPKAYVLDRWAKQFAYLDYIEDERLDQNVIVVRK